MKFFKKEPYYICRENKRYEVSELESSIEFITSDHPDFIVYEIKLNLNDGNCIWNKTRNRSDPSSDIENFLIMPLVREAKLKMNTQDERNFIDTTKIYFKSEIDSEIASLNWSNSIHISNSSNNYLNVEIVERVIKSPIKVSIQEFLDNSDLHYTHDLIPLEKDNGVYFIKIRLGGKDLRYLLDSGASDMAINETMEKYLLEIGVIRNEDYRPDKVFRTANGMTVKYKSVLLSNVKLGNITIQNVLAYICPDSAPLLFGKSALDKLSYWKIDNTTNQLEVKLKH